MSSLWHDNCSIVELTLKNKTNMKSNFYSSNGCEVDWMAVFECYALNNSTKEFENCSGIQKFLFLSEEDREKIQLDEEMCGEKADYIVYDKSHYKIGYIIVMD